MSLNLKNNQLNEKGVISAHNFLNNTNLLKVKS